MLNKKRIRRLEGIVFLIAVICNLTPLFNGRFFPTLDGPAHLYNAQLIRSLISNPSGELENFFEFRLEMIPNWTGHFILTFFGFFLPPWIAEKLLLVFYMVALPYSFRMLIQTINKESIPWLSYLAFPFTHSFVFFLGFYNFCLSFIFLFFTLCAWIRYEENSGKQWHLWIISGMLLITYFSHLVIFIILIALLAGYSIFRFILLYIRNERSREILIRDAFLRGKALILVILVPCIFCIYYFYSHQTSNKSEYLEPYTLVSWLKNLRPLIVFNFTDEEKYTKKMVYVIAVFFIIPVYERTSSFIEKIHGGGGFTLKKCAFFFTVNDFWLLAASGTLLLYFFLPDSLFSAGYLSVRLCLLFYLLLIFWLSSQAVRTWLWVAGVAVVLYGNFRLNQYHGVATKDFKILADECFEAGKIIPANSIVFPLNNHDHWFTGHFSNYLGVEKPMIILENYEAGTRFFPVQWKPGSFPVAQQGKLSLEEYACNLWNGDLSKAPFRIDYVFILGKQTEVKISCMKELKDQLKKSYTLVFSSPNIELHQRLPE